jgi:hypothetical protein
MIQATVKGLRIKECVLREPSKARRNHPSQPKGTKVYVIQHLKSRKLFHFSYVDLEFAKFVLGNLRADRNDNATHEYNFDAINADATLVCCNKLEKTNGLG